MSASDKEIPRNPGFPRAREAREVLRKKASDLIELMEKIAIKAAEAGEYEAASKTVQWLLEHMPADDDGVKAIDTSIDKQPKIDGRKHTGPQIQIGFAIGGIPQTQALPAAKAPAVQVIDVTPETESGSK